MNKCPENIIQSKLSFSNVRTWSLCLLVFAFTSGCKSDLLKSADEFPSHSSIQNDYLKKTQFPFEIISAEAHVGNAVKAKDKIVLSYELDITNAYRNSIIISKIEVVDFEHKNIVATFDSSYLLLHLLRPGIQSFDEVLEIKTSAYAIANLWLELEEVAVPSKIFHRISYKLRDRHGKFQVTSSDLSLVDFPELTDMKIGLPFDKGKWFYIANAHRDARLITEGKSSFPQRYAIDWAAVTEENKFEINTLKKLKSFYTYQQNLLAVKDGTVVFVKDSIPDNDPFKNRLAIKITRESVGGNYVVLDIGNDIYAFYGHLVPRSIRVQKGDKVKQGDILGKLGNSGNSNGPHLHFHLETKSKYPLGGEGVPYVFENYNQIATYSDKEIDSILSLSNIPLPLHSISTNRSNQLPIGNGIVEF